MDKTVVSTNIHYYLALVNEQTKVAHIKTNSKEAREYFKSLINEDNKEFIKVFKLRGHSVDEVYANLCGVIGEGYTLDTHRNRQSMPSVMPIEL